MRSDGSRDNGYTRVRRDGQRHSRQGTLCRSHGMLASSSIDGRLRRAWAECSHQDRQSWGDRDRQCVSDDYRRHCGCLLREMEP